MEAELKFEKENTGGIAVVGSYLIDAAKRLGVEIHDEYQFRDELLAGRTHGIGFLCGADV